jgi:hypothetical protein
VFSYPDALSVTGVETDLHVRVYDSELVADTYIGRADLNLSSMLAHPGPKQYDLSDPENFRKNTGHIELLVKFEGTGGPQEVAEIAPIMGQRGDDLAELSSTALLCV